MEECTHVFHLGEHQVSIVERDSLHANEDLASSRRGRGPVGKESESGEVWLGIGGRDEPRRVGGGDGLVRHGKRREERRDGRSLRGETSRGISLAAD
jgi:hypothetical protein